MAAAINGDWDAVEFLMDHRAELDNKDLKDQSIVHLAAQYDQHELIENLLDHQRTERDFMVNENDQYVGSSTDFESHLDVLINLRTTPLSILPAKMDSLRQ